MQDSFPQSAVYALTPQGMELAQKIALLVNAKVFVSSSLKEEETLYWRGQCACNVYTTGAEPDYFDVTHRKQNHEGIFFFSRLQELLQTNYTKFCCHIFVAATGIVIRSIAPLLLGKDKDPAILVVDQKGKFVISLLSGHLGKANKYTQALAFKLGATSVITTATDVEGLPAIDSLAEEKNLVIANLEKVKVCSAALLRSEPLYIDDSCDILGLRSHLLAGSQLLFSPKKQGDIGAEVRVGVDATPCNATWLGLHPKVLFVGVGCKRGIAEKEITFAIESVFQKRALSIKAIGALCSFVAKADEEGLIKAAKHCGVPLYCFTGNQLALFPQPNESPHAFVTFGIKGVCESAAMAGAHMILSDADKVRGDLKEALTFTPGEANFLPFLLNSLLVEKTIVGPVTVAVALHVSYLQKREEYDAKS